MAKRTKIESTLMFTDIVGYSKLTGDNQSLALEILEEHDGICKPIIKKYSGKIIKHIGDAIFCVFPKVISGVKCAIEIQTELKKRNSLNSDDRKILIRIGLHFGETYYVGEELLGDGVNIASQVEPIAPYGGIAITESIYNFIRGSKDIYSRSIGYILFKNTDEPIRVHKVYLNLLEWIEETIDVLTESMKNRKIPIIELEKKPSNKQFHKSDLDKYRRSYKKLINKGESNLENGKFSQAENIFNDLFNISRKFNDGEGMGISLIKIGEVYHQSGDLSSALRNTISGVRTFAFEGYKELEMKFRFLLADRYAELGLEQKTKFELEKIKNYFQSNSSEEIEFQINKTIGNLSISKGEFKKAIEIFEGINYQKYNKGNDLLLVLCEMHLLLGNMVKTNSFLKIIDRRLKNLSDIEQIHLDSIRIYYLSRVNKPDYKKMELIVSKCLKTNHNKKTPHIWRNLTNAQLWLGDLNKAEEYQQHAQDSLNSLLEKISDNNIKNIYIKKIYIYKDIFSFLELPSGVKSIENLIEDDKEWCFDCGKFIKESYNFCPHCGVTLESIVL